MSERCLPDHVLRCPEPREIVVDGVRFLARELTPSEYGRIASEEFSLVDGSARPKGTYGPRLIEACVVDPPIPDANVLNVVFATKLAVALDEMMGNHAEKTKNE